MMILVDVSPDVNDMKYELISLLRNISLDIAVIFFVLYDISPVDVKGIIKTFQIMSFVAFLILFLISLYSSSKKRGLQIEDIKYSNYLFVLKKANTLIERLMHIILIAYIVLLLSKIF